MRVENGGSLEELEGKVREVLREIEKTSDSILNAASQRKSLC